VDAAITMKRLAGIVFSGGAEKARKIPSSEEVLE
jgi:hypothetical protein